MMAVQPTAILLGHAQPFNPCPPCALQRAALTSARQVRYEQAKHVDGLQSDSCILLKYASRSRVMAGSP